ncbi:MAG: metalloregulator ArsR/SmtB family transcription factor [Candidatus Omnitrophota bacterium]|nr:metalloregulator ArsR/SmtB family transcription factor [Candidatus Omnitrophota bacterium]MDZ4241578.1 metalloregulator ArsR/SmtB family transcription factor [Candidatus Omnitrophota bacterium]
MKNCKPDHEKLQSAADMLRAVAHPVRLRMVQLLRKGHLTVGVLQARLGISQSLTSQHLSILKSAGIVKSDKIANACHYTVLNKEIFSLLDCLSRCHCQNEKKR